MKKIVINKCFGGFGLSNWATIEYFTRKGHPKPTIYTEKTTSIHGPYIKQNDTNTSRLFSFCLDNDYGDEIAEYSENSYLSDRDIPRDDPDLVAVLEEFGSEKVSGYCAELAVVEIPDDVEWDVQEYDGQEWIAEKHRTWS